MLHTVRISGSWLIALNAALVNLIAFTRPELALFTPLDAVTKSALRVACRPANDCSALTRRTSSFLRGCFWEKELIEIAACWNISKWEIYIRGETRFNYFVFFFYLFNFLILVRANDSQEDLIRKIGTLKCQKNLYRNFFFPIVTNALVVKG